MLLLLGTYYANREYIAFNANYEVGNSYTFLIDLYRNYSASHSDSSNYTLINSIDELMKKNKELNDKMEEIKSENSEHLSTISNSITNTSARISDFEADLINTKADVSGLNSKHGDVEDLKTKVDDLNNKTLQGSDSVELTEDENTTILEVNQINGGKF